MDLNTEVLYLMVRLPPSIPFEKISVENVSVAKTNMNDLKSRVKERFGEENLHFIFRGNLLKSEEPLISQGVRSGSIIQVVKAKKPESEKTTVKMSESEVQNLIWRYRSVSTANFHKASRPEFIKKILDEYPNLRNNLSAISILKDPILLASMGNPDTIRRIAEEHYELIEASKFIVDTLNNKSVASLPVVGEPVDDLDSSSSDEPNMPSTSTSRSRQNRRITSNQLAQALGQVFAGGNSANSLANISQRNLSQTSGETSSNNASSNRITQSMFMNALTEVLRSTRSNNEARQNASNLSSNPEDTESTLQESPTVSSGLTAPVTPSGNQPPMYLNELQQMREMGLTDTEVNLQALMICNGDLETAINLVLSGGAN